MALEPVANRGVLLGRVNDLHVADRAHDPVIDRHLVVGQSAKLRSDQPRHHTRVVAHRRHDPIGQVVLQLEEARTLESAVVGLGPDVGAGLDLDELHGEAQLGTRTAQPAAQEVPHTAPADRGTRSIARVEPRTIDDREIRKASETVRDVLGEPFGERRERRIGCGRAKRHDRDRTVQTGSERGRSRRRSIGSGRVRRGDVPGRATDAPRFPFSAPEAR